jgi:glycosyltransferase involved in cell wall biosynthesis
MSAPGERTEAVRVLAFGTFDVARHPRVQILIDGLREHGVEVEVCNATLGLTTAERVAILRQPWRLPVLGWRLLRAWGRLVVRSTAVRRRSRLDAVLVGYLGHFDVLLARVLFPRTTIVLDHLIFAGDTAADRGVVGLRGRLLQVLDRWALSSADMVLVDTAEHAAMVPARLADRVLVVPVGADATWQQAQGGHDGVCSVVFYGLMTPLQGAPVIARALALLDGEVRATVIGQGQDGPDVDAALVGVRGVDRRSWVEPGELARLVAAHDVCLGIFGTGGKARRVVPNKVYQGAAAGCAVVTSDTAPQQRALREAAVYVPPGDPEALAEALRSLARDRPRLDDLRRRSAALAADSFTPAAVTVALVERLGMVVR